MGFASPIWIHIIFISVVFVRKKSNDLLVVGKLLIEMVERGFLLRSSLSIGF